MGDPRFDLGNLSVNNDFDEADDERLLTRLLRRSAVGRAQRAALEADARPLRRARGGMGRGAGRDLRARLRLRRATRASTSRVCRPPCEQAQDSTPLAGRRSRRGGRWPGRVSCPTARAWSIIGGGVGGASIAYHLAELGERDVVLLDRDELTSGSTFHSAGLVGQLRSSVSLTRMMMDSRRALPDARLRLGAVRRHPPGVHARARAGGAAPGRLGEDVRPAARADLRRARRASCSR